MFRIFVLLSGLLVSVYSFAHEGHNHNDPMSPLIHLIWIAPAVIAATLTIRYLKQRFFTASQKEGSRHYDI